MSNYFSEEEKIQKILQQKNLIRKKYFRENINILNIL